MTDTSAASKADAQSALPIVYVVDDDESIRESLVDLFRSIQMEAASFATTTAFLDKADLHRPGCILLDVRLPGLSGLDFQLHLERIGSRMPIVFMTGFGDIPMSVRAMKAGAVDFLTKPFRDQDILDAVGVAIEKDMARRREMAASDAVASLVDTLTPREREVMAAVVKGLMNKQIAYDLGISEITVKLHRGNVMRKMQVRSVADLVRKSEMLEGR
ncbi:FixJ family two-component response regulator [Rhizobium sp. BK650]|uniref:response regulator transcription factor n=1 Tax=Rhizobium sp. BK650 TaxID=2586990 RepID=UPI001620AA0C|nr:response regulator transcription factor [Rhizobium sp. BK650]MBB3654876.1 FixJ family two-component response regulator [Rhizobium sp. BK650]